MIYEINSTDADFFTTAIMNPNTGETDLDIIAAVPASNLALGGPFTQVTVVNNSTGHQIFINGTGMTVNANGDPIGGTINELIVTSDGTNVTGFITDISWSLVGFANALDGLNVDNFQPLANLINQSATVEIDVNDAPGTDASGILDVATALQNVAPLITSPILHNGSVFNETGLGGSGNDTMNGSGGNDTLAGGAGNDIINGGDGNDVLVGGSGNDTINPGDNDGTGDSIEGGLGNDRLVFSDIVNGWVGLFHNDLSGPITATVNGVANTGSVDAGAQGTDTLVDVVNPLNSGWTTGGLRINGTSSADIFNVTLGDNQWMDIAGLAGNDTINLNLTGTGYARLSYHTSTGGVTADLGAGTITQDGFTDQLNLTVTGTPRRTVELRTGNGNDSILGSANDESFITRGGNDTIDGGGGIDRMRFDRNGFDAVNVNLAAGTATGTYNGAAFSHTLSNIEYVRGSRNGNDTLVGSGADETFSGRGGNDTITGAGGDDTMFGGSGTDTVVINANSTDAFVLVANNQVIGGGIYNGIVVKTADGDDLIIDDVENIQFNDGTISYAQLMALAGTDQTGTGGRDTLDGGANGDLLDGAGGGDVLNGNGGNDSLIGGLGFDVLNGGLGDDTLLGGAGNDRLFGNAGADLLNGGVGFDRLFGGSQNDTLIGGGGNDTMIGGGGNDRLVAGTGSDRADGGIGNDTILGEGGNDTLIGGGARDRLVGGIGNDSADGGLGNDTLLGGGGEDTLLGGVGNDRLIGNNSNDRLVGGIGADQLSGGGNRDILIGGGGNDTLNGGAGFDTLLGGDGDDVLTGGTFGDRFVFADGNGNDTISDFSATTNGERINLGGVSSITSVADLNLGSASLGAATQVGADVVIDTGGGNSVTLTGVNLGDLDAGDFIF